MPYVAPVAGPGFGAPYIPSNPAPVGGQWAMPSNPNPAQGSSAWPAPQPAAQPYQMPIMPAPPPQKTEKEYRDEEAAKLQSKLQRQIASLSKETTDRMTTVAEQEQLLVENKTALNSTLQKIMSEQNEVRSALEALFDINPKVAASIAVAENAPDDYEGAVDLGSPLNRQYAVLALNANQSNSQ